MHIAGTQEDYQRKKKNPKTNPNKEATDVGSVKTLKTFRLY